MCVCRGGEGRGAWRPESRPTCLPLRPGLYLEAAVLHWLSSPWSSCHPVDANLQTRLSLPGSCACHLGWDPMPAAATCPLPLLPRHLGRGRWATPQTAAAVAAPQGGCPRCRCTARPPSSHAAGRREWAAALLRAACWLPQQPFGDCLHPEVALEWQHLAGASQGRLRMAGWGGMAPSPLKELRGLAPAWPCKELA